MITFILEKTKCTVNLEMIAMFFLLPKMQQGYNCNNLNSYFEFFLYEINRIFLNIAKIKITF